MSNDNSQEQPTAVSTATDSSTADLWFERFAELLGCETRPGAIAAAIEMLRRDVDRIPSEMSRNRIESRDAVIRQMRKTSVNCGHSSSCAVAGWFKTSDEQ